MVLVLVLDATAVFSDDYIWRDVGGDGALNYCLHISCMYSSGFMFH